MNLKITKTPNDEETNVEDKNIYPKHLLAGTVFSDNDGYLYLKVGHGVITLDRDFIFYEDYAYSEDIDLVKILGVIDSLEMPENKEEKIISCAKKMLEL